MRQIGIGQALRDLLMHGCAPYPRPPDRPMWTVLLPADEPKRDRLAQPREWQRWPPA